MNRGDGYTWRLQIDRKMPLLKNVDDENNRDYVERFIFL